MSKLTDVEVGLRESNWTGYCPKSDKYAEFSSFDIENDWIKSIRVMYSKNGDIRIFAIFNAKVVDSDNDLKKEIEKHFTQHKIMRDEFDWGCTHRWMITKTKSQSIRLATFLSKYLEFEEPKHEQWWKEICDGGEPISL